TDTIELTRDPMLRVAVPNKGALSEAATDMLGEAGYSTRRGSKTLVHQDEVNGVEFFYLRPRDIAIYIGSGILDAGITGRDLMLKSQAPAKKVLGLGFGASRFFYAEPWEPSPRPMSSPAPGSRRASRTSSPTTSTPAGSTPRRCSWTGRSRSRSSAASPTPSPMSSRPDRPCARTDSRPTDRPRYSPR